jgi:hypothetical protein
MGGLQVNCGLPDVGWLAEEAVWLCNKGSEWRLLCGGFLGVQRSFFGLKQFLSRSQEVEI